MNNLDFAIKAIEQKKKAPEPQIATDSGLYATPEEAAIAAATGKTQKLDAYQIRLNLQKEIKNERRRQGLTQWQLGKKAGYSAAAIGRIEKHGWGTSVHALLNITAALGKELTIK